MLLVLIDTSDTVFPLLCGLELINHTVVAGVFQSAQCSLISYIRAEEIVQGSWVCSTLPEDQV